MTLKLVRQQPTTNGDPTHQRTTKIRRRFGSFGYKLQDRTDGQESRKDSNSIEAIGQFYRRNFR